MTSIHVFAIVLGIFALLTRLPGVIWPEKMREIVIKFLDSKLAIRIAGLIAFHLALLIFFLLLKDKSLLEIVVIIIALIWLPAGLGIFFAPQTYKDLALKVMGESISRVSILSFVGCTVGLLLILLGLFG